MKLYQNRSIDNKANFYGADTYVIMCSGAFQILSQSIKHHANFIPVLTYLHGNIGFGRNKGGAREPVDRWLLMICDPPGPRAHLFVGPVDPLEEGMVWGSCPDQAQ